MHCRKRKNNQLLRDSLEVRDLGPLIGKVYGGIYCLVTFITRRQIVAAAAKSRIIGERFQILSLIKAHPLDLGAD